MTESHLYTRPRMEPLDRLALAQKPEAVTWDTLTTVESGRFSLTTNNATYECFIRASKAKRLFVMLSGAGRQNSDINFARVSWGGQLNGITLNVEDPMYIRHPGLAVGWYYGTAQVSYMDEIAEMARRISHANGIQARDIIFVGSSAGGTAALYLADAVKGSTCLAMNPQVIPARYHYAGKFKEITGIDLKATDPLGRTNLRRVSQNRDSRFIVCCNLLSREDFKVQVQPWLEEEASAGYGKGPNGPLD